MNQGETRRELARVLAAPDTDTAMDAVVKAFWMRAKPLHALALQPRREARVVDLRQWALAARRAAL
jgi:hypothetical protein